MDQDQSDSEHEDVPSPPEHEDVPAPPDYPSHIYDTQLFRDLDSDEDVDEEESEAGLQDEEEQVEDVTILIDKWKQVKPASREARFNKIMRLAAQQLPLLDLQDLYNQFSNQFIQFKKDRELFARDERAKNRRYNSSVRRSRPPKPPTKLLQDNIFILYLKVILHHPDLQPGLAAPRILFPNINFLPNDLLILYSNMELRSRDARVQHLLDLAHNTPNPPQFRGVTVCNGCFHIIHACSVSQRNQLQTSTFHSFIWLCAYICICRRVHGSVLVRKLPKVKFVQIHVDSNPQE
jgi:hypothetical protein